MNIGRRWLRCLCHGNSKVTRTFTKSAGLKQVETAAAVEAKQYSYSEEWENANSYEELPGPKPLPIPRGNIWRFLPFGTFWNLDPNALYEKLFNDYGPIVKISGIGPQDVVVLFNPDDVAKMFRNESPTPIRKGMESMKYYRNVVRRDLFGGYQGLVTSEGEEWMTFRKIVNQPMLQPRSTKMYIEPVANVSQCFIDRIRKLRDENMEMPDNFLLELNKWALESIAIIALDTRFGCLEDNLKEDSDAVRMINAVNSMFDAFYTLEYKLTPWKYVWTPTWGRFVKVMDTISEISKRRIDNMWEKIKNRDPDQAGNNRSILENILLRTDNHQIAFTMAMDMLIAGIDTTSTALANTMYLLSKNPDKQEKLFTEIKRLMPEKDHMLTDSDINEAKYLKACIKETHRLTPIVLGTQREAIKDMVLSNFRIPKRTLLLCHNAQMCRQEVNFIQPSEFKPERWLKSEEESEFSAKRTNPFVYLPFGFGPRTCIGRRFAELELNVIVSKIVRNFKLSYAYGDMTWKSGILNIPNKPLKIKMEDRN